MPNKVNKNCLGQVKVLVLILPLTSNPFRSKSSTSSRGLC